MSSIRRGDALHSIQALVALDMSVRLLIWVGAIVLTSWVFTLLGAWPRTSLIGADLPAACSWGCRLVQWVILYNLVYLAELLLLRLLLPTPRLGRYPITPGGPVSRQVLWACLLGILVKARVEAPFPGFLVFHLANLPPMRWLMGPVFGPRSRSCSMADVLVMDPDRVSIGRNVVIGYNAVIAGHHQERDAVIFSRTIIEDDVVVGGDAIIFGGVHLKSGCMIGANAVVLPNTVVGPNEFWAGVPARKIRDLPPVGDSAIQ